MWILLSKHMHDTFFANNPQNIRKLFRGDSKLPDHHQEDQESQGCPPSGIKEIWILMGILLFKSKPGKYDTFLESSGHKKST